MKNVLILDTETDGIDPETNRVLEVGAVLYSLEHATILGCYSALIKGEGNAAEHVNRIPPAALIDARAPNDVWAVVDRWARKADAFVAHNAAFDRGFTPAQVASVLPWICTCHDIEWPGSKVSSPIDGARTRPGVSLVATALEHGVGVASAHRAITDCLLLARLFERVHEMGHDVPAMLARGLRPKARFVVADSNFDEKRNALAKAAGFRWEKPHWVRTMAIEDADTLPFAVRQESAA